MRTVTMPVPVLGFAIVTRAALAAGLALLVADRLSVQRRRAVGMGLFGFGAVTTIPAAWMVFRRNRARRQFAVDADSRLIGTTRYPRKGDDLF
jgi:hypothetical protein